MIPEHIKNFSKMCEEAIATANKIELPRFSFDKIAVCGMGGSGASGDLLADLLRYDSAIEVNVVKSYHLPLYIDKTTLIFCVSYSGNTEETLSCFSEAYKKNFNIISITSGGKLQEWSEKLGVPVVLIPKGYQPRDALPYMFLPMVVLLQKFGIKSFENDLREAVEVTKEINLDSLDEIAAMIKNSDIAIYSSDEFAGTVRRFKNEFNENAKMIVRYDLLPELNHNEINGYQRSELNRNIAIVFLRDKEEKEEIKIRVEVTKEVLRNYVSSIHEIWSVGKSKLAKIISYVYMASYLTAKIAELVGVDRERVIFVEKLKDELKKKLNFTEKLEKNLSF